MKESFCLRCWFGSKSGRVKGATEKKENDTKRVDSRRFARRGRFALSPRLVLPVPFCSSHASEIRQAQGCCCACEACSGVLRLRAAARAAFPRRRRRQRERRGRARPRMPGAQAPDRLAPRPDRRRGYVRWWCCCSRESATKPDCTKGRGKGRG